MVKETPKILYKALRQYAHNTRVGDLFAGFDYDETVKIVESLEKILADTIVDSNDQRHNFVMSEIKVKSQAKEIEGLRELIENIKVIQTHQLEDFPGSYEGLKTMCKSDELLMDEYSDGYVEVEELRELLKDTTQPDTKQKD